MCYNKKWKKSFILNVNKFGVIRKSKYRIDWIYVVYSPLRWGWFSAAQTAADVLAVFPTGVGVILAERKGKYPSNCVPHGSGGDSESLDGKKTMD